MQFESTDCEGNGRIFGGARANVIVRSWRRLPAVGPSQPRRGRRFPWARILLIGLLIAAAAYLFLPRYFNITADGMIEGDLVPVAPLFRARIDHGMVACSDHVTRGQPIATVSNFLLEEQYAQDSQKLQDAAQVERASVIESVAQARIDLETQRVQLAAVTVDAAKKRAIFDAYDRSFHAGAVGRVSWESARFDWQSAREQVSGVEAVIDQTQDRIRQLQEASREKVGTLQNEAAQSGGFQSRVHGQTLFAPVSGSIVDCTARPEAIVEAGTPLYHIFATDRAYVLAFFDPKSIGAIHVGQRAGVRIAGDGHQYEGRVSALYPTLSALPDPLQRFFWQHVQWSEYRPVKITFSNVPRRVRDELVYNAQVKVAIPQHRAGPSLSLPGLARTL